ncbi:glycosyltransferase family 4 protein [bacterium]|nr:MAG: glycosyltransferase family 4 protein [bacterium]
MNIAYISNIDIPGPTAISEQVLNSLSALSTSSSHTFTLIVPRYAQKNLTPNDVNTYYGLDKTVDIKFFNYFSFLSSKTKKRIHAFLAPLYCMIKGYDLLYTRHQAILFFCLLIGKRTIFETYRIDINFSYRYYLWRKFCYSHKKLFGIVTHSKIALDAFVSAGLDKKKIFVAYNGCGEIMPATMDTRRDYRERLGILEHRKVLGYVGRIGTMKQTDVILHVASRFPELTVLIVGGATRKEDDLAFDDLVKKLKLNNVIRTGVVKPCEVHNYLCASDILIIPPSSVPMFKSGKTVLPLKTFLYLAASKPIIAPNLPDISEILKHQETAVLVDPDNFEDTITKLKELLNDTLLQSQLSEKCRETAKKFTWSARAEKIEDFINIQNHRLHT